MGRTPYRYIRQRLLSELGVLRKCAPAHPGYYDATIYQLQRALVALRAERRRPLPRAVRFLGAT